MFLGMAILSSSILHATSYKFNENCDQEKGLGLLKELKIAFDDLDSSISDTVTVNYITC